MNIFNNLSKHLFEWRFITQLRIAFRVWVSLDGKSNRRISSSFLLSAFPSVGAGKLNIDPQIVAKAMVEEAYSQLATNSNTLDVFFVLLPDQKAVYDAFVQHLRSLPGSVINARTKTQPKSKATVIQYDQKSNERAR